MEKKIKKEEDKEEYEEEDGKKPAKAVLCFDVTFWISQTI